MHACLFVGLFVTFHAMNGSVVNCMTHQVKTLVNHKNLWRALVVCFGCNDNNVKKKKMVANLWKETTYLVSLEWPQFTGLTAYTGCPQKSGTLDCCYFDIWKYSITLLISSDKTLSSEKNNTKIIEIVWVVSMFISQNIVIVNFLFILVTFQSGIMAILTSIHCCPEAHWSMQTKQRELIDSYTRQK